MQRSPSRPTMRLGLAPPGLRYVPLLASLLALAPLAHAGDPGKSEPNNADKVCRADQPRLDKFAYLRALSLDLRGVIPTPEEIDALAAQDDVTAAQIDAMLATGEFVTQAVRRHRDLLWPNISNVDLLSYQAFLGYDYQTQVYWRYQPAFLYRGAAVPCDDVPARIDNGVIAYRVDENGHRREGWVKVAPYWDPGYTIKLCAFDAQTTLVSSRGVPCGTNSGFGEADCGCGPDARFCIAYDQQRRLQDAVAADLEARVAAVVGSERPYTELFTGRTAYINGALAHYLRYQTGMPASVSFEPLAFPAAQLPEVPFADATLHEVALGPEHAGVLTSPAYLLRFQTNRARANRYFDAFLCQPFQPPVGGLPSPDSACSQEPDLQQRCGCKYCHSLLEPAAAHWGRWGASAASYLDPVAYPPMRPDCLQCATTGRQCTQDCVAHYLTHALTAEEKPYLGKLTAYYFRRPEHVQNVEQGPRYLALSTVVDGRLPACTATRTAQWLMGRELAGDELAWADSLGRSFVAGGYSYRALVRAVVTSEHYRRAR